MITDQLQIEDITHIDERYHRLVMFDPTEVYQRIYKHSEKLKMTKFSHYKRFNSIWMDVLFPTFEKGFCACGCDRKLEGRARRWFSKECTQFASSVFNVISGKSEAIRFYLREINGGYICSSCGINERVASDMYYRETKSGIVNSCIHLDHIIPVHQGGGGCWLSNYQFLCVGCHREKTKNERKVEKMLL